MAQANQPPKRKSTSVVVDKKKDEPVKVYSAEELDGHRHVDTFCEWVTAFHKTGHFVSQEAADDFAKQLCKYIAIGGYVGSIPEKLKLT